MKGAPRWFALVLFVFGGLFIAMGVSMWPPPATSPRPVTSSRREADPSLVPLAVLFSLGGTLVLVGIGEVFRKRK